MKYRLNNQKESICVECRKDEKSNWWTCAWFDEESRLIFEGDLSDEMCEEIYSFLESQCIHIDENARAWVLIN